MTRKIGILTFHDALNYGAVLQAYALQSYLSQDAANLVEIIDYKPSWRKSFAPQKFTSDNAIKQLVGNVITVLHHRSFRLRKSRFLGFVKQYHNLSQSTFSTLEDLTDSCGPYDVLITGSDQVFNPKKDSQVYYLGFEAGHCKRIGYAPSLGLSRLDEQSIKRISPWLHKFNAVSCREKEGAEVLGRILGYEVPVVCDPVCLISKSQWESIAVRPRNKGYIFVFDLNGGKPLFDLAQKVSAQTGLPILYSSLKAIHPYVKNQKTRHDLGPLEWLGHIINASYVVTDSFHGTMLSLILDVPILNRIALASTSSRITSIMNQLGISDQIVDNLHNFDIADIRFEDYHTSLHAFIDRSKNFLSTSLNL